MSLLLALQGTKQQAAATFGATGFMLTSVALRTLNTSTFAGSGSLSYLGSLGLVGKATLADNSPSFSGVAVLIGGISAEFDGAGLINSRADILPPGGIFSPFSGAGSLLATATQHISSNTISFSGAGGLFPTVVLAQRAAAVFRGSGLFLIPSFATIFLSGAGNLQVDTTLLPRIAEFDGMGALSAIAVRQVGAAQTFGGNGLMAVHAFVRKGRGGITTNIEASGPGTAGNIVTAGG